MGIYFSWDSLGRITVKLNPLLFKVGSQRLYTCGIEGLNFIARYQTQLLQNGSLRNYLSIILVSLVTLTSFTLVDQVSVPIAQGWSQIRLYEWLISALIVLGAFTATRTQSPLAAITALGLVGYGVALVYILFGAPDLAMTQFLVETLTVILFALVLVRLPGFKGLESKSTTGFRKVINSFIAISFGALMTGLLWVALDIPLEPSLAQYFSSKSLPEAHGRNIVNVILVDFRALDTLGEITVVMLSGIGVVSLIFLGIKGKQSG
jgi:multicomponent Na+:H+ antiporter subunit A